jgi:hypothetical protein
MGPWHRVFSLGWCVLPTAPILLNATISFAASGAVGSSRHNRGQPVPFSMQSRTLSQPRSALRALRPSLPMLPLALLLHPPPPGCMQAAEAAIAGGCHATAAAGGRGDGGRAEPFNGRRQPALRHARPSLSIARPRGSLAARLSAPLCAPRVPRPGREVGVQQVGWATQTHRRAHRVAQHSAWVWQQVGWAAQKHACTGARAWECGRRRMGRS